MSLDSDVDRLVESLVTPGRRTSINANTGMPMLQYAQAAEASAARQNNRRGSGGSRMTMIDGDMVPHSYLSAKHRSGNAGGAGFVSSSFNASSGTFTSNSSHSVHSKHHIAKSTSLPSQLHPSASQLTPLPHFSHESLGAYQLRIDAEFAGDIFSLRHNNSIGVHQKTALCLAALERLANTCIVNNTPETKLSPEQENQQAIMSMLSTPRNGKGHNEEEQLDGIPLSQHHTALRSTILNLRSMLMPLLVAPRQMFQEALNKAEECAVKYNAIRYEVDGGTGNTDSVKIGPDGRPIKMLHGGTSKSGVGDDDPEESETFEGRREEELRAKEEKLRHVEALLQAHEGGQGEQASQEEMKSLNAQAGGPQDDDDDFDDLRKPRFNHKFLFTRDDESGLDSNTVPYYEIIQNFQYMKTNLQKKVLACESKYLEGIQSIYGANEEIAYLKELNRGKDLKVANSNRIDAKLHEEFSTLRAKLNENYVELKKIRAKNAEMKKDMKKVKSSASSSSTSGSNTIGGGSGGASSGGAFGSPSTSKKHHASTDERRGHQSSTKEAKKAYEDIVMSLKERNDEIVKFSKAIVASNAEKDNLTTQVEILEQAVQTMRYMIKDILKKINENEMKNKLETLAQATGAAPPALPSGTPTASSGGMTPLSPQNLKALRGEGIIPTHLNSKTMIACKGTGKHVPKFLQYSGWVTRYDLGKRSTELIIKEIWSLKTVMDETRRKSGLKRTTLQDFFQKYLTSRFPHKTSENLHRKMEFTYNFVESCERYRADHDMDLFFKILFHQCSEERYIDQMTMMAHFKKCLTQMDIVDGVRDGFIHKMVFFAGLRQFFPVKSEENMRALIDIVLREMQTKASKDANDTELVVDISKLMAETSDGDESAFIDAIRNQYEEEVNAFPEQIAAALYKASKAVFGGTSQTRPGRNAAGLFSPINPGEGWLPAGQIAAILQELDPAKSKHEIDIYMRRGLAIDDYFLLNPTTTIGSSSSTSHHNRETVSIGSAAGLKQLTTPAKPPGTAGGNTTKPATPDPTLSRKGSAHQFQSPVGLHASGSSSALHSPSPPPHRDSLNNTTTATPSTPNTDQHCSSSRQDHHRSNSRQDHQRSNSRQGSVISPTGVPQSNTRMNSRIGVGLGLTFNSPPPPSRDGPLLLNGPTSSVLSPTLNTGAPPNITTAIVSPPPIAAAAPGSTTAPPSTSRRSDSRRQSSDLGGRTSRNSVSPGRGGGAQQPTSIGVGGVPTNGYSYDPCHFVELAPFLERLNTLFLHRTGHYNSELDIPGLGKLIKDELERQADEERKAREALAAKRGLGSGLQVNSLNLPAWSSIGVNWKRTKNNPHVRDELLAKLIVKYSISDEEAEAEKQKEAELELAEPSEIDENERLVRINMPIECFERENSADAETAKMATLLYKADPLLNQVVTFYRGDATKLQIDAIVNAANPQLVAGGGICAAIFSAAGHHQMSKACGKLNGCGYGQTKVTPGFKLPCKYVLHSVSPVDNKDSAALESCYNTILDLCFLKDIRSVALCCLATGIYGFKHMDAAEIALRTTRNWLERSEANRKAFDRIVFCVFLEEDLVIYNTLLNLFFPISHEEKNRSKPTTPGSGAHHRTISSLIPGKDDGSSMTMERKSSLSKLRIMDDGSGGNNGGSTPILSKKRSITFLTDDGHDAEDREKDANREEKEGGGDSGASTPRNRLANRKRSSLRMSAAQVAALFGGPSVNLQQQAAVVQPPTHPPPNPFTHRPGTKLSSFKYEAPRAKEPPTPKTASQLFSDAPVAFVPPPVVPKENTPEYADYMTKKSGEQAKLEKEMQQSTVLLPIGPDGLPVKPRAARRHTVSLHGLARLVKKSDEDDDD